MALTVHLCSSARGLVLAGCGRVEQVRPRVRGVSHNLGSYFLGGEGELALLPTLFTLI